MGADINHGTVEKAVLQAGHGHKTLAFEIGTGSGFAHV
jgi:hypothetical protein